MMQIVTYSQVVYQKYLVKNFSFPNGNQKA